MRNRLWWVILLVGLVLWAFTVVVTALSHDVVTLASSMVMGSFLVPIAALTWWITRLGDDYQEVLPRVVLGFLAGGTFSLTFSVLLDYSFHQRSQLVLLPIVAFCETLAQALVIAILARTCVSFNLRHGMVIGAAVGFGFAAFETLGISMTILARHGAAGYGGVIAENLVLRDLLVPFSHGLWMSLIGGAIWIARSGGKWISRAVIGYFAVVVVLHTIWDYAANSRSRGSCFHYRKAGNLGRIQRRLDRGRDSRSIAHSRHYFCHSLDRSCRCRSGFSQTHVATATD